MQTSKVPSLPSFTNTAPTVQTTAQQDIQGVPKTSFQSFLKKEVNSLPKRQEPTSTSSSGKSEARVEGRAENRDPSANKLGTAEIKSESVSATHDSETEQETNDEKQNETVSESTPLPLELLASLRALHLQQQAVSLDEGDNVESSLASDQAQSFAISSATSIDTSTKVGQLSVTEENMASAPLWNGARPDASTADTVATFSKAHNAPENSQASPIGDPKQAIDDADNTCDTTRARNSEPSTTIELLQGLRTDAEPSKNVHSGSGDPRISSPNHQVNLTAKAQQDIDLKPSLIASEANSDEHIFSNQAQASDNAPTTFASLPTKDPIGKTRLNSSSSTGLEKQEALASKTASSDGEIHPLEIERNASPRAQSDLDLKSTDRHFRSEIRSQEQSLREITVDVSIEKKTLDSTGLANASRLKDTLTSPSIETSQTNEITAKPPIDTADRVRGTAISMDAQINSLSNKDTEPRDFTNLKDAPLKSLLENEHKGIDVNPALLLRTNISDANITNEKTPSDEVKSQIGKIAIADQHTDALPIPKEMPNSTVALPLGLPDAQALKREPNPSKTLPTNDGGSASTRLTSSNHVELPVASTLASASTDAKRAPKQNDSKDKFEVSINTRQTTDLKSDVVDTPIKNSNSNASQEHRVESNFANLMNSSTNAVTTNTVATPSGSVGTVGSTEARTITENSREFISYKLGSQEWNRAIGQKVILMVAGSEQSAELTLNPPELGPLQVVLNLNDNQVNANFISANMEVREAIEAAAPRLREMMDNAGVSLTGFSVNSQASQSNQQERSHQRSSAPTSHEISRDGSTENNRPSVVRSPPTQRGSIDTFV